MIGLTHLLCDQTNIGKQGALLDSRREIVEFRWRSLIIIRGGLDFGVSKVFKSLIVRGAVKEDRAPRANSVLLLHSKLSVDNDDICLIRPDAGCGFWLSASHVLCSSGFAKDKILRSRHTRGKQ